MCARPLKVLPVILIAAVLEAVPDSDTIPETDPDKRPDLISNVLVSIALEKVPVGALLKEGTKIPLKVPAVFKPELVMLLLEIE